MKLEQREQQQGDPVPSEELTYSQRVYRAYQELVEERRRPDVPTAELYARVGGSLAELHDFLRAECQAHHCVPTTGEPLYANPDAIRSALVLPDEIDRETGHPALFLNVKLIEPPTMPQAHEINTDPSIRWTQEAQAFAQSASTQELLDAFDRYVKDFSSDEARVRYNAIVAELNDRDPKAYDAWSDSGAHSLRPFFRVRTEEISIEQQARRYESLLRETAELRYPPEERTPELEARIESTIARKVGEFRQEREIRDRAKAFEASLWQDVERRHPDLSPEEKEHYHERIRVLVDDHRAALARHQNDAPRARSQEQGRGIER